MTTPAIDIITACNDDELFAGSARERSAIYLDVLPKFMSGQVRLIDSRRVALAEIEGEDGAATAGVNEAQAEVRAAAEAVMAAEADEIAIEVERLDALALELRTRLGGGSYAPIALRGVALSPTLARVLQSTDAMENLFAHNGVLNNRMKAAGRGWLQFIEALLTDPDAELNFDPPKQSMAAE